MDTPATKNTQHRGERHVMEKKQRMVRLLELMMCRGTVRTMRLMPARHDAPSSSHARTVTAVSSSGPSHKKCRKIIDI